MIKVIEGKDNEEFVKSTCKLMYINDEHKINVHINSNLINSMSVENNNEIRINVKENEDTKYNVIYMLQKYRYCWICDEKNKDKRVSNIINNYLANYYMMTLLIDYWNCIDDLDFKNKLDSLKEQICNACRVHIIKFSDESETECLNEINCFTRIGEVLACRNVLRKYNKENNKYITEANALGDILEKLEWHNINEMYSEIEQAFNLYFE